MANLDSKYSPDDRINAFKDLETGCLISLAGPGTGKTSSLLGRIEALLSRGVSHPEICYLTFIKEISNAFTKDYIEKFGEESYLKNRPRISTLHSFACRLLRNQGFRIGYDGQLFFLNTIEKNDASQTILEDLFYLAKSKECNTPSKLRGFMEKIKKARQDELLPEKLENPTPYILSNAQRLFRVLRIVDWDQIMMLASSLVSSEVELPSWITEINHYLVDEYQDFNKAEQKFLAILSKQSASIVIVGDNDQSIYHSRGGAPQGIMDMFIDSKNDQVSLINCYRSRKAIVETANNFQKAMSNSPRPMIPKNEGGDIFTHCFRNSDQELEYLLTYLKNCLDEMPEAVSSRDATVCLFPGRRLLDSYFNKISKTLPCYKRKEEPHPNRVKLERIFILICRPGQRFIERLLLNQFCEIKPRHKARIIKQIIEKDYSVYSAILSLIEDKVLLGKVSEKGKEFCKMIEDFYSKEPNRIAPYIKLITPTTEIGSIMSVLEKMIKMLGMSDIEELIKDACDVLIPESIVKTPDPRSILFLTIHGSKGLTAKNIVLPGLEKAWLPGSSEGDELNEKRRLFYVALTRATDSVLMTFPYRRSPGDDLDQYFQGCGVECPFVKESALKFTFPRW